MIQKTAGALLALLIAASAFGAPPARADYVPDNTYAYATANLNLRTGPGTGYSRILTIPRGSRVYVDREYDSSWYNVVFSGRRGYVNSAYLSRAGTSSGESAGSSLPIRLPYACGFEPGEWTWYGQSHKGWDICSRVSRAVYAPISGRVDGDSITVTITGDGTGDKLHHLVDISVKDGQYVSRGQYVGAYAEVGRSRGAAPTLGALPLGRLLEASGRAERVRPLGRRARWRVECA